MGTSYHVRVVKNDDGFYAWARDDSDEEKDYCVGGPYETKRVAQVAQLREMLRLAKRSDFACLDKVTDRVNSIFTYGDMNSMMEIRELLQFLEAYLEETS